MLCKSCGKSEFESDPINCYLSCTNCGAVIDDSQITSGVAFDSHAVVGTFISSNGRGLKTAKGISRDSHELTLARAQREIQILATNMKLSQRDAEAAFRIYTLAQQRNFVQGRKSIHVIAASLYIVCRQQKSAHLLIDFSDHIGEDLFILGTTYRKLVKLLHLQVPLIDPSLFIHRFCSKLEFDDKTNIVAMTANRIVQRMRRDWMSSGRRPTGLCGAAILISARYHGFKRSTQQILHVVRVCNDTIRKRLEEFEKTLVASLTREEFESLDLENSDLAESNPPSFRPAGKGEKKAIDFTPTHSIKYYPETETLSDVEDREIDENILSPEESQLKSIMWNTLNSEWIEAQKGKKAAVPSENRKQRKKRADSLSEAKTPAEALKLSGKLSNKMKIEAVEMLFIDDKDFKCDSLL